MGRYPLIAALCAVALLPAGCGGSSEAATGPQALNWYVFNEPGGAFIEAANRCTEQAGGRYSINIVPLPTDADQQRELIVRRLAAGDPSVDIIGMDVIWTAELAEAGWIREWTGDNQAEAERGVIPALLETARYQDRLWAAPLNTNTQLLWYRKDIVDEPPATWDEMLQMSEELGEEGGIQIQGARYEGLTVWFNSLVNSAGGQILDESGNVVLGEPAVTAADIMSRLANSPTAADPGLSNNKEDEARLNFQSGGSAFQLNYTFIYPSATGAVEEAATPEAEQAAQEFVDNLGAARWPAVEGGEPSHVTLGGINLGVSSFSRNPELAFEAAQCLRQPENQLTIAELGGLPPTNEALYDSKELQELFPFSDILQETLADGVPRPVTPAYSDVSLAIQQTLHPPRDIEPQPTVDTLRERLDEVARGGLF